MAMIIRMTDKLARKVKETVLPVMPKDPNGLADWSARLFTFDRAQYILISNTATLYSTVIHGKGITDADRLIHGMLDNLRDLTRDDGFQSIYEKCIAPETARFFLAKAFSRSVTGSMNEIEFRAKFHLSRKETSPYDVSFLLNKVPMSYLEYESPREAFERMAREL
jgi:hypothetical protein